MPLLAVTMGDPAGIGPEIAARTFNDERIYHNCRPVLVGDVASMERAIDITGSRLSLHEIDDISKASFKPGTIDIFNVGGTSPQTITLGEVSASAGEIAFRSIVKAIQLAMKKKVDATVTGPINKEAINKAGYHFSGHTEIFAHYTGSSRHAMLLINGNIKVIHVSTHVSLRNACNLVKKERILEVIHLLHEGLKRLGYPSPRIGIAGLNPHSGDGGLFGNEDIEEILPAVLKAKSQGINAEGPVSPDTLFALANGGKYDGCVAMYHDQGHIPFKLLGFKWDQEKQSMTSVKGINITLGLPIIRTSVDHGTAFEIAGKGIACPDAMVSAIEYAIKLSGN